MAMKESSCGSSRAKPLHAEIAPQIGASRAGPKGGHDSGEDEHARSAAGRFGLRRSHAFGRVINVVDLMVEVLRGAESFSSPVIWALKLTMA